jgi:hypothetical protein
MADGLKNINTVIEIHGKTTGFQPIFFIVSRDVLRPIFVRCAP